MGYYPFPPQGRSDWVPLPGRAPQRIQLVPLQPGKPLGMMEVAFCFPPEDQKAPGCSQCRAKGPWVHSVPLYLYLMPML